MLMLTAYFDESGKDPNTDVFFTLAGYLSSVGLWEEFELHWVPLLKEFDIPYSHAVDMAHFTGPFADWDAIKRLNFERRAHELIKKYAWKSFDVSLKWSDYQSAIQTYTGSERPPAYAVLTNTIILEVAAWLRSRGQFEPVHYVFEHSPGQEGWILDTYRNAPNEIRSGNLHLLGVSFAEGKKWINGVPPLYPLQAADMNAYEINKNRRDGHSGRQQQLGRIRGSLDNLRGDDREMTLLTEASILDYLRKLERGGHG